KRSNNDRTLFSTVASRSTAMAGLDLILTASAPTEAPPIDAVGKFTTFERPSLTMPFNVTDNPMCCGYTDGGLPLSLQLVGRRFDDMTVLRLAHTCEQATSWRQRRPALSTTSGRPRFPRRSAGRARSRDHSLSCASSA